MWCSASQGICSSSSSGVMGGTLIFLMITECPEMAVATSLPLIPRLSRKVLMASTTAVWFMIAPSTIVCAGSGLETEVDQLKALGGFPELDELSRNSNRYRRPMQFLGIEVVFRWLPSFPYLHLHGGASTEKVKKTFPSHSHRSLCLPS